MKPYTCTYIQECRDQTINFYVSPDDAPLTVFHTFIDALCTWHTIFVASSISLYNHNFVPISRKQESISTEPGRSLSQMLFPLGQMLPSELMPPFCSVTKQFHWSGYRVTSFTSVYRIHTQRRRFIYFYASDGLSEEDLILHFLFTRRCRRVSYS